MRCSFVYHSRISWVLTNQSGVSHSNWPDRSQLCCFRCREPKIKLGLIYKLLMHRFNSLKLIQLRCWHYKSKQAIKNCIKTHRYNKSCSIIYFQLGNVDFDDSMETAIIHHLGFLANSRKKNTAETPRHFSPSESSPEVHELLLKCLKN